MASHRVAPDFVVRIGGLRLVEDSENSAIASNSKANPSNLKIVYFDVQSTGFSPGAEVIQLAARYGDREYSDYVMPKGDIPEEVADLTGLFVSKERMLDCYNKCQPVPAVSKKVAVENFLTFLKSIGGNLILVAYNCVCYDAPMLCGLISEVDQVEEFKKLVSGFSEAIGLFKKKLKDGRNDKNGFKLAKLADDFLREKNKTLDSVVHVKWLQRLINHPRIKISEAELIDNHKPAKDIIDNSIERKRKHALREDLNILKVTVSDKGEFVGLEDETIDRFVEQDIGLHDLYSYWKHGGEEYVKMIISTPMDEERPGSVIAEDEETVQMILDNLAVVFKHGIMSILGVAAIARDKPFPFFM